MYKRQGRWVLLGEPAAGKSTLCRELCHRLGGRSEGPLPVMVPLGLWAAEPEGRDPFDLVEREARSTLGREGLAGLAPILRARAQEREGVWLLLDGLDEVNAADRGRIQERLSALCGHLGRCAVVVTSRTAGYERGRLQNFREARLLPLDPPEPVSYTHLTLPTIYSV